MTERWWAVEHHMHFNYQVLFNVCWGPIQLRTITFICKSLQGSASCLILKEDYCWGQRPTQPKLHEVALKSP